MNDKTDDVGGQTRRKDTTEYSSSKAPETRREAEEQTEHYDERLHPGGSHGAAVDVGMSSLDRDTTVTGGRSTGQQDYGDIRKE